MRTRRFRPPTSRKRPVTVWSCEKQKRTFLIPVMKSVLWCKRAKQRRISPLRSSMNVYPVQRDFRENFSINVIFDHQTASPCRNYIVLLTSSSRRPPASPTGTRNPNHRSSSSHATSRRDRARWSHPAPRKFRLHRTLECQLRAENVRQSRP